MEFPTIAARSRSIGTQSKSDTRGIGYKSLNKTKTLDRRSFIEGLLFLLHLSTGPARGTTLSRSLRRLLLHLGDEFGDRHFHGFLLAAEAYSEQTAVLFLVTNNE